jgi:hypothetical protein
MKRRVLVLCALLMSVLASHAQFTASTSPTIKYVDMADVSAYGDKKGASIKIEGLNAFSFLNNTYLAPDVVETYNNVGFEIAWDGSFSTILYSVDHVIANNKAWTKARNYISPYTSGLRDYYVGFRYLQNSAYFYGWIRIELADYDNSTSFGFKVKDYAYQTKQGEFIAAGEKSYYLPANPTLMAHYPFDGNANDIGGKNYNGSIIGTVKASKDFNGNDGKALELDGSSYVDLLTDAFFAEQNYTYSMRFKNNNFCVNSYLLSLGLGHASQPTDEALQASNNLTFSSTSSGFNRNTLSKGITELGSWHQFVMIRSNYEMKFFLDGILLGSKIVTSKGVMLGYLTHYLPKAFVGNNQGVTNAKFKGLIDDLKIYNYAISDADALRLSGEVASGGNSGGNSVKYISYFPMKDSVADIGPAAVRLRRGTSTKLETAKANNKCQNPNEAVEFAWNSEYSPLQVNSCLYSTNEFTFSTWYNIKTNPISGNYGTLISTGGESGDHIMYIYNSAGQLSLKANTYYKDVLNVIGVKTLTVNLNSTTSVGWHHAVCVRKTDSLLLYLDGNLGASMVLPANTTFYGQNILCLGSRRNITQTSFQGFMDETKIFNYPITKSDVKNLFNMDMACVLSSNDISNELDTDVLVFPNPAQNELFIRDNPEIVSASLTDITGKIVAAAKTGNLSFNVSQLAPGTYFVDIKTKTGSLFKKFIKN